MIQIVLVGVGGFIGAVLRHLTSDLVQRIVPASGFPYGTLAVNLLGCLVIGFLAGIADARQVFSPESRALVFVGVLGAFTTFSTFGNETANLFSDGRIQMGLLNIGISVALGLAAIWVGSNLSRLL